MTALAASVTGGVYRAPQITLAAGVRLALTSDLTLVADNALRIDGIIALAPGVGQPVHVVLVSLNDSVRIGPAGRVGPAGQTAVDGIDAIHDAASAMASSPPGVNGGYVKILAPLGSILIEGEVNATSGGAGGLAGASGGAGLLGWRGGDATATAGQGGGGGDVLLAALEGIVVSVGNGTVRAGTGGMGGDANATGRNSEPAKAEGGPGNVGGTITCIGLAANLTTAVNIGGWVVAGSGGAGGLAQARVVSAGFLARGGSSTAGGGKGDRGGAVEFRQLRGLPEWCPRVRQWWQRGPRGRDGRGWRHAVPSKRAGRSGRGARRTRRRHGADSAIRQSLRRARAGARDAGGRTRHLLHRRHRDGSGRKRR